jgi:hypothetical protein
MVMAARPMTLKESLIAAASDLRVDALPKPPFEYSIGWAKDYSTLFRNDVMRRGDIDDLLKTASRFGRVMLCGRGGSGKTTVLRRLAIAAAERSLVPILIDLRRWSFLDEQNWRLLSNEASPRMDFLLSHFGKGLASVQELDLLSTKETKILILDGINEVPFNCGNEIIATVDETVAVLVNACALVSDRLIRRPIRSRRWAFALVEPLSREAIKKAWSEANRSISVLEKASAAEVSLLDTPFFLDEAIRDGLSGASPADSLRKFFVTHSSLSDGELQLAARAAYEAYREYRSRTFSLKDFEKISGNKTAQKLRESNVLICKGDQCYFRHHLHHDFLAAFHLAKNQTIWNHDAFNIVTLNGSSFDAIGLTLAQVGSSIADDFVRKIYDWNPYAAAYALSPDEEGVGNIISAEMEHVILCMLAERRWDPVLATVERAEDALSIFPTPDARRYLSASDLSEVAKIVSAVQSDEEWFQTWRKLFIRLSGSATSDEINLISDEDGVFGWTAANVLKRLKLTSVQQKILREKAKKGTVAVRWRVAHVLGAFPGDTNFALLKRLVTQDPDEWVRYGSIRSIVEMAARAPKQLRNRIFLFLGESAGLLKSRRRVLDEFARAVLLRPDCVPANWSIAVGRVVRELLHHSDDVSQLDRWARLLASLRETYASN